MSNFGRALQVIMNGSAGVTAGGIIVTLFTYPVVVALGKVGASLTFGIIATVFIGFTVDYYINLKSVYDKQRIRRENYKNATPIPASDTIEGSLAMLNNAEEVAPKKLDSSEYDSYYNTTIEDEQDVETDTIVETGEDAFSHVNDDEDEEDDFNKRFLSNVTINNYDDNLSNNELATSKYDPEKFSSPQEYIKTQYVPEIFLKGNSTITGNLTVNGKINGGSQTVSHKTNVSGEPGTFCETNGGIYDGYEKITNTDCICQVVQSYTLNSKIVGIITADDEFASHGDVLVKVVPGTYHLGDILCPDITGKARVATETELQYMMLHAIPRPKITSLEPLNSAQQTKSADTKIEGMVACFIV